MGVYVLTANILHGSVSELRRESCYKNIKWQQEERTTTMKTTLPLRKDQRKSKLGQGTNILFCHELLIQWEWECVCLCMCVVLPSHQSSHTQRGGRWKTLHIKLLEKTWPGHVCVCARRWVCMCIMIIHGAILCAQPSGRKLSWQRLM